MKTLYYRLYVLLSYLATPFMPLIMRVRAGKGKEDSLRQKERFGHASVPRPDAPLIWVHAASMGESQSVMPLIKRWNKQYRGVHILLTTVTTTSARHVVSRLPERAMHQYAPLDVPMAVERFLRHWQPDVACFVDSELWPNTIIRTHKHGIPLVLLNGRISRKSADRWHKVRPLCEYLLQRFSKIFAKSDEDTKRFVNLGAEHPVSYGNMKFSSPALPSDSKQMGKLVTVIGDRPVWLAASTHEGEEKEVGEIHNHLSSAFPSLLTIIVPRHNNRGDRIRSLLEDQGLEVAQRSRREAIKDKTNVYVADTMGELGMFYRIASIVFIGGSLVPHGGQNPMEAAHLDCAILYGPHMDNFREFCTELERVNAAMPIRDAYHLRHSLEQLLRDQDVQDRMAKAALGVMEKNKHVIEHIQRELRPIMAEAMQRYRNENA